MPPGFHFDQYALYAENMDKATEGGCQTPGCTHENHASSPMFLTGKCHRNAGQYLRETKDPNGKRVLVVHCRVCDRVCASLYIDDFVGLKESPHIHVPNWRIDIGFVRGEARCIVLCAHPDCRQEIGWVMVTRDPNPAAPVIREPLRPMALGGKDKRRRRMMN